jgi:glycerol kinase
MRDESHMKIDALRGDGGPTRDAFLMQFQSDIIGVPVRVS